MGILPAFHMMRIREPATHELPSGKESEFSDDGDAFDGVFGDDDRMTMTDRD